MAEAGIVRPRPNGDQDQACQRGAERKARHPMKLFLIITAAILASLFIFNEVQVAVKQAQIRQECRDPSSPFYINPYLCKQELQKILAELSKNDTAQRDAIEEGGGEGSGG